MVKVTESTKKREPAVRFNSSREKREPAAKFDRLLNQDEVAELIQVSPKTLEYWRYKGTGPQWVKVGSLPRYRVSDIQNYIANLNK